MTGAGSHSKIQAICHLRKSVSHALIASEDQYVLYDLQGKQIIDTIVTKKKSSGQAIPTLIDVSHDDLFSIEASQQSIILRNLRTNMALARFEGHQHSITSLAFSPTSYVFASAANSECLLWNPRDYIKSSISTELAEVSQPDKLFDLASSDLITRLSLKEIGDGTATFMAAVSTAQQTSIFYAKSSGKGASASGKGSSKVVKKDCVVRVQGQSEQIVGATIVNETTLNVVYGNIYSVRKAQARLLDDQGKINKVVELGGAADEGKESSGKVSKHKEDQVEVMGIEQEGNARVNGVIAHHR